MTQGNSMKLIFQFFLPILIGNLFQQLYSFVDSKLRIYFQQHMNMVWHDLHF